MKNELSRYITKLGILSSTCEYKRLVRRGVVRLNGTRIVHDNAEYSISENDVIKIAEREYIVKLIN